VVVACSLAAALGLALATVCQQRGASRVAHEHALRPSLLLRVARQPVWLAGKAADTAALGLQALALAHGSLLVVQPLLALGLVAALAIDAAWSRRLPAARDLLSGLAITLGVAMFVLLDSGAGRTEAGLGPWLVAGAVAVLAVAGCLALAAGRGANVRGALYAGAGAVTYALSGALLKQVTGVWRAHAGWPPLVASLLGFLLIGAAGTVLVQTAFQVAPLRASIGVLTVTEPVAASLVGVAVFGERLAGGAASIGLVAVAVALAVSGIAALSTSAAARSAPATPPAGSAPTARGGRVVDGPFHRPADV
jgi:drug/metabolite transporter (DMT)-like permease